MLTLALTALFTVIALGSILTLADSALKWRNAYHAMKAELDLDRIAAVPVCNGAVVTLRPSAKLRSPAYKQATPAPLAIAA